MKSRLFFFVTLVFILMVTGCARFSIKPEKSVSMAAGALLEQVRLINTRLNACKGIGMMSFKTESPIPRMRFAWLCDLPDRIRLELLAPTGIPLLTVSADGTWFYVLSHSEDHRLHKRKAKRVNLEKIISIPLTIRDASHLLAGAIPLHAFDTAERIDLPDGNYMLHLRNYRPDKTENIFFDKANGRPHKIEFIKGGGHEPEYSVYFNGIRLINGATIPESITLRNDRNESVDIDIQRFWPESGIEAEKFILTTPS